MSCNLPALKKTFTRQSTAGNVVLLLIALWVFYPYLIDRYRGEPAIQSSLSHEFDDNAHYIHEITKVKHPNRGSRINVVYDNKDRIICSKNIVSYWDKDRDVTWNLKAFADCDASTSGIVRACSIFSVYSKSGIERKFGSDKSICTEFFMVGTEL